jgi:glucosamine-6-phosphate deaminase
MVKYDDFYESGLKLKMDKDVYHYLTNVASENAERKAEGALPPGH